MSDTVIAALLGAISGIIAGSIAGYVAFKTQKPLSEANAAHIIQEASADLIKQVQAHTTEQLKEFDAAYRDVVRGSWALHKQVRDAGKTPVYTPPPMPRDDAPLSPQYGGWKS
jgi:hypothetical protein